ncbi:MAG: hypothetical protein U0237_04695 [Thermoleophilia bacterium]
MDSHVATRRSLSCGTPVMAAARASACCTGSRTAAFTVAHVLARMRARRNLPQVPGAFTGELAAQGVDAREELRLALA